jgi:hypothetical protein
VAAEVQHRRVEQPLLHQIQHVGDAPGAAIAIVEGVDALELVADQRHLDQGVDREELGRVDKTLQTAHQLDDLGRVLRGRVNGLPAAVLQRGAGQLAQAGVVALELALNLDDVIGGEQATVAHFFIAHTQGLAVAQHLLGGRIGKSIGQHVAFEQLVVRGDDVLDLGAVLRLLHAQGVDQDALVGDRPCHALQFSQRAAAAGQLPEDGRRVKACRV